MYLTLGGSATIKRQTTREAEQHADEVLKNNATKHQAYVRTDRVGFTMLHSGIIKSPFINSSARTWLVCADLTSFGKSCLAETSAVNA
jgi:hypothetical protein